MVQCNGVGDGPQGLVIFDDAFVDHMATIPKGALGLTGVVYNGYEFRIILHRFVKGPHLFRLGNHTRYDVLEYFHLMLREMLN